MAAARAPRRGAGLAAAAFAVAALAVPLAAAGPAEVGFAPGFVTLPAPVPCGRFEEVAAWAARNGYRFPAGEGRCRGRAGDPAVAVGWNTAAVWANALSERAGLVPAYRDAAGAPSRDAAALTAVPTLSAAANGYRLPSLADLGRPRLRGAMTRLQEWTGTRVDLGDGRPYYYLCRPGACDIHSPGTSGRGVAFRLVRPARR